MQRKSCIVACASLLLVVPAWSGSTAARADDDETTDAETKALEQAVSADRGSKEPSPGPPPSGNEPAKNAMNPAIALILDAALAWFSVAEPLQGGAHDPRASGFTLQQLEMQLEANVDTIFKLAANVVFSQFGVEVEEAYAQTLSLPGGLQMRAGQFLTRFGKMNATHPHAWAFVDQPMALTKMFGSESNRGLGAELSWLTPAPWVLEIVGAVTMPEGDCCARSYFGSQALDIESPADLLYTVGLKQFYDLSPDWGLSWGISAQFGPSATGHRNRSEVYGTDLYLRYRPVDDPDRMALSLHAELFVRGRQVPGDALVDYASYVHLLWTISPQWEAGLRYEHTFTPDNDPLDPEHQGHRHRASVQATFRPSHFSRVRIQGTYDTAQWRVDDTFGAILAVEFLIGAHGAHAY